MSDRSDYDNEATVGDDERNYQDKSETGNVRAINIKDDKEFLRKRLLAEEREKEVLEAAIENKIPEQCGLQYWEKRANSTTIEQCLLRIYICPRKEEYPGDSRFW